MIVASTLQRSYLFVLLLMLLATDGSGEDITCISVIALGSSCPIATGHLSYWSY